MATISLQQPLLLTEADVRRLLTMEDLIDAMERALGEFSDGRVRQPVRTVVEVGAQRAFFGVMPACLSDPPALGAKLVTVFGSNEARGLPTHLASILLFDCDTGALAAILDGRYITEARTAAVSAVATRHLARRDRAGRLAILGSGVQARSHLEALRHAGPITDVRVWSPTGWHRERFAVDMAPVAGCPVKAVSSAQEAVDGADVVVLATAAHRPVIHGAWVAGGTHVVGVGACRPDQREMDADLVARGRLFVDSRAGALAESGDVLLAIGEGRISPDHIVGELGDLVRGRIEGRRSNDDVTIFKSLGMAVEDVAAAHLAYRRGVEQGTGVRLSL